jgi:hypothetical protein
MKILLLLLLVPFSGQSQLDSLRVDYPLFLHFGTPAVWTECIPARFFDGDRHL